jgi:vacuolar-type H+-ATPase subunit F/Vma7
VDVSRLLVLTTPELAAGYRLAGSATLEIASSAEAEERLEALLRHEEGVIALHAPYFYALSRPLRRRLETISAPLVVALPAGARPDEAHARRERLLQTLRHAVGYEITFSDEPRTP